MKSHLTTLAIAGLAIVAVVASLALRPAPHVAAMSSNGNGGSSPPIDCLPCPDEGGYTQDEIDRLVAEGKREYVTGPAYSEALAEKAEHDAEVVQEEWWGRDAEEKREDAAWEAAWKAEVGAEAKASVINKLGGVTAGTMTTLSVVLGGLGIVVTIICCVCPK